MGCGASRSSLVGPGGEQDDQLARQLKALAELSVDEFHVLLEAAMFWMSDTDHNGLVSRSELRRFLAERSSLDADAILAQFDADKDGSLNIDEFGVMLVQAGELSVVPRGAAPARAVSGKRASRRILLTSRKMSAFLSAYHVFDKNKDSVLDYSELQIMLKMLLSHKQWRSLSEPVINSILTKCKMTVTTNIYSFPAFLLVVAASLFSEEEAIRLAHDLEVGDAGGSLAPLDLVAAIPHIAPASSPSTASKGTGGSQRIALNTSGDSVNVSVGRRGSRVSVSLAAAKAPKPSSGAFSPSRTQSGSKGVPKAD